MSSNGIQTCPLFADVEPGDLASLLKCLSAFNRTYARDEFIFSSGERAEYVGIVLRGGVNVLHEDFWGNRSILTRAAPGDIFGEAFSCAEVENLPVSAVASESSEIMLLDCRRLLTTCRSACVFHSIIIKNLTRILAVNNVSLTKKMEHVSKRTIREKLLSYLSSLVVEAGDGRVLVPFNRQELADYLAVDRSALSRELSLMRREGLIKFDKSRFELL